MTIEKTKFEFFRRAGLPGNGHLIQLSPRLPRGYACRFSGSTLVPISIICKFIFLKIHISTTKPAILNDLRKK